MLNSFVVENNGGKINGENYGNNIGDLCGAAAGVVDRDRKPCATRL